MAILGINTRGESSAVCMLSSTSSISALCEKHSRAFPHKSIDSLRIAHDSVDCIVTHQHSSNEVRQHVPRGVSFERVDYCEALSMATIASTDWSSCAILLSDSFYTRLGYYVDGSFYWIREFTYPNNIALFSASVSRFLGYDLNEDYSRWLSLRGESTYSDWITSNAVNISDGNYQILYNLERGFGVGMPNEDVAASAQLVFSSVLVALSVWLRNHVDIPRLAIVGRSAANYITNSAIAELSGYDSIAAISITGAASTALGAAALLQRPLLEHQYVGPSKTQKLTPDELANKLLLGDIVTHYAEPEFSDNSFVNANRLTIAYKPRVHEVSNKPYYVLCQDTDYHKYFENKFIPYFGQYNSGVKNKQVINTETARVLCVSKNKNPYMNRVLEITRAAGYPVIVSTQINEI